MITKDNNLKIMTIFYNNPSGSYHMRELARLTKLSSTGVIKIVKRLKKEKLLVSKKTKITEEVSPDFDGRFTISKRLYNIFSLYEVGLIALLKKHYELPEAIILFGSFSEGMDTEKSDIDIAILSKKKDLPDLKKFEKKLCKIINLHVISPSKTPKDFLNSIANGLILDGFANLI